jgi:RNA polymerase sigma factor (sigma-70 family)
MSVQPFRAVLTYLYRVTGRMAPAGMTDPQLLGRFAREGDEEAFAALMRRHGPLVMGVCRRLLRHEQDAEDVFQATFLVLERKASHLAWRTSVGNWLYEVAYRLALRTRCDESRRRAREVLVPVLPEPESPSDVARRDLVMALDEELHRLPERLRAPLLLCYLDGATQDEAARQLGWSLRTLRRRLEQGRELLRLRFTRRGVTLSVALLTANLTPSANATLPHCIIAGTARAALVYAKTGRVLTAEVPGEVQALADGAVKGFAGGKLKPVLFCGLAATVLGVSMVLFGSPAATDEPLEPADDEHRAAQAAETADLPIRPPASLPVTEARLRLGTLRFRGGSMALSRKGATLAACGWDGKVHLMNAATGDVVRKLSWNREEFRRVAFSPDGRWLAAGSLSGLVYLWDTTTWAERDHWQSLPHVCVWVLAFSPHNQNLASAKIGYPLHLWRVDDGANWDVAEAPRSVDAVAFSEDGRTLVCASTWRVFLLSLTGDHSVQELRNPTSESERAAGQKTVALSPADAELVDDRGQPVRPQDVRLSRDRVRIVSETLAVAGYRDGTIRLFKLPGGKEVRSFHAGGPVSKIAFSPDGRSLVSSGSTLRLWETASGRLRWQSESARTEVAFSPDGLTLFANGADYVIRRFKVADGTELGSAVDSQGSVAAVAIAPNGRSVVVAGKDAFIRSWSLPEGKLLHTYPRQSGEVERIALSPDGKLLASHALWGTALELWDAGTGQHLRRFEVARELWSTVLAFISNQVLAWSDQVGVIHLLDTTTGQEVRQLGGYAAWPAFSPDGSLLAFWKERPGAKLGHPAPLIQVWDVLQNRQVGELAPELPPPGPSSGASRLGINVQTMALAPQGPRVAFAERRWDGSPIYVYDIKSGKKLAVLLSWLAMVQIVAYSHDGKLLAAGGRDGTIWLWDGATHKPLRRLPGHQGAVTSLAFAADNQTLISGSDDTTVLVWDLRTVR